MLDVCVGSVNTIAREPPFTPLSSNIWARIASNFKYILVLILGVGDTEINATQIYLHY